MHVRISLRGVFGCVASLATLSAVAGLTIPIAHSAENITLASAVSPGENRRDEPLAKSFSLEKAISFLDSAALTWQKERKCFTCHTNFAYLYVRPTHETADQASAEVRQFAEELVAHRWEDKGPRWDAEVVAAGAALAFNDALSEKPLHPLTRRALDRMLTLQREDGGFTWIKCDWPPMESDDHYGATLATIAIGVAPDGYAQTKSAQLGLSKLREYFKQNPGTTLHHRAMVLWGNTYVKGTLTDEESAAIVGELLALQTEDGGWGLATLGDWKRADGEEQDLKSSDGYGTGFVIYILRRSGLAADDPRIQRGIEWLKSHQRESGRWFTRSLHADSMHYITHAGTAFAVMALQECDETK